METKEQQSATVYQLIRLWQVSIDPNNKQQQ
jgi:hypothetical protein